MPIDSLHGYARMGGTVFLQLTAELFWAYFAATAISVTGLTAVRGDVLLGRGTEKIISLGRIFYAMPMAVFGTEHFTDAKTIVKFVPAWMPWPWFWLILVGLALLAASLSISVRRVVWLSAPLLGLMLFLFVALISLPAIVSEPGNRTFWAVGLRDLSFSGGALALGGVQPEWARRIRRIFLTLGRCFIGLAATVFGVFQLWHPECVPGVPLSRQTPEWIPGHIFWSYPMGLVSLAAGACLLANQKTREAATALGVMVLLVILFVYLPILGASLEDIGNGWNYFVDTLAFSGAALLLADAMPKEEARHV